MTPKDNMLLLEVSGTIANKTRMKIILKKFQCLWLSGLFDRETAYSILLVQVSEKKFIRLAL